jgi:TolB-like protein/Tfp pilus assembly protein PilF
MSEDDEATVRTLTAYREELSRLIAQHRGRLVDSPGDNLLAEFASATDAVRCAVESQGLLRERNAALPPTRQMPFRMGVHLGEVMVEGERIYGDGVNIAARLEGLAEPGGIRISRTVHEQVGRKLELPFEDLGEHEIKNIPDPVRVYRIAQEEGDGSVPPEEAMPGLKDLTVPGFAGRPAIAVLPFENMSKDPDQEYFADGLAEDLITRLSSWRWFPVIARNSSFVYKGQAVDARRVSQELGVRYFVEGSVRKAGSRVRVTAQLIDATTGHHVWAERYDRELEDIFAVQDEITEAIVASLNPELRQFEMERAVRREPRNLDAWDCAQRGWWHLFKPGRENKRKALALYEKAIELDPRSVWAHYGFAMTHYNDILDLTAESRERSAEEVVRAARRCIEIDDQDPLGHVALGAAHSLTGQRDEMLTELELAIQLNPSLSTGHYFLGNYLAWNGRSEEALTNLEKAMRLNPKDPMIWVPFHGTAMAHFAAGRYAEAADWAQRSLRRRPDGSIAPLIFAASLSQLDRLEEARAALGTAYEGRRTPALSAVRRNVEFAAPAVAERFLDGLRRAGLPE